MDVEKPDAEAEGEAETEEEQPKKRARTEFCRGRSRVQPCIFAQKGGRFGLAVQLHRGQTRCQFCDAKSLAEVAKDPIGKATSPVPYGHGRKQAGKIFLMQLWLWFPKMPGPTFCRL